MSGLLLLLLFFFFWVGFSKYEAVKTQKQMNGTIIPLRFVEIKIYD